MGIGMTSGAVLQELKELFEQGYGGKFLAEQLTRRIDLVAGEVFRSVRPDAPLAVIATGGYGREEMAPYSDVDILFLAPDRKDTETAGVLLHRLWDTGMTISHAFRTPGECIEEAMKDIRTRTSLLEARYVAGSRSLFETFRNRVYPEIARRHKKEFIQGKLQEMEKRHRESGDSVFLLEPNIKEGEGGLRDVHTMYWLSKVVMGFDRLADVAGLLDPLSFKRFSAAYDFLLRTRFSLHFESGRKNDLLSFEFQKGVAASLDFRDSKKFRASERMMRYYYLKSRIIRDTTRRGMVICSRTVVPIAWDVFIRRINDTFALSRGTIIAVKKELVARDPVRIMEAYALSAKKGKRLGDSLRESIRANLMKINRRTRNIPAVIQYFLSVLKSDHVYETLRDMHETGVLGRILPEFGAVKSLVVHEPYHMYTVDEHTLLAIRNLEALRATKYKSLEEMQEIINGLRHPDALYLALLLHDIGKAAGRHHEEEGYKRLKSILDRFHLGANTKTRIEFLVRNHILMSRIALKHEVSDSDVIARFAEAVGDAENLGAIYLMTYADMSAVNPKFWTSWKAYLLKELYLHTMKYLAGLKQSSREYMKGLITHLPAGEGSAVAGFVENMPERYVIFTAKEKIMEDYRLVKEMETQGFAMRVDMRPEGIAELVICTRDFPGLFAKLSGFLSSKGLNIVQGRIFTGKKGIVIDKISVSNWKEIWWEELEQDIEEGLRRLLLHGVPLQVTRQERRGDGIFDIFVEFDNESSEEYSIVEVFSPDRIGLLYDISQVLHEREMNIDSARINTDSGLAHDVFYIQREGRKVPAADVQGLLSGLWAVLRG